MCLLHHQGDNFSDLMSRHPDVEATAWQLCAVPLVSSTQEEIFKNFEHSGIRKELLDSEVGDCISYSNDNATHTVYAVTIRSTSNYQLIAHVISFPVSIQ